MEYKSLDNPHKMAKIVRVESVGDQVRIKEWLGRDLKSTVSEVEVEWLTPAVTGGES